MPHKNLDDRNRYSRIWHAKNRDARWLRLEATGDPLLCKKCDTLKPLGEFYKYTTSQCKECRKISCRKWFAKNSDQALAANREWAKKNPDKVRAIRQRYLQRVKDSPERRKKAREYMSSRSAIDPEFKLIRNMRKRVASAMKNGPKKKTNRTMELLGCTTSELREEMELMWSPGMNWGNYGRGRNKWNVDHIIPCTAFDMSRKSHQFACFGLSNLQPMWQVDNDRKTNRTSRYQRALLERLAQNG